MKAYLDLFQIVRLIEDVFDHNQGEIATGLLNINPGQMTRALQGERYINRNELLKAFNNRSYLFNLNSRISYYHRVFMA